MEKREELDPQKYINDVRYYQTLTSVDNSKEAKELYDSSVIELANAFYLTAIALNGKEQEMMEKACEVFCKTTCAGYKECGRCFVDGKCQSYQEFKNKLEE